MVTATVGSLMMKGRKTGKKIALSLYFAGNDAIGDYIACDWNAPAGTGSPNFWSVPEIVDCIDFMPGDALTGGQVEFTSDGQRTNNVQTLTAFQSTNQNRPVATLPALAPGHNYRLLVVNTVSS